MHASVLALSRSKLTFELAASLVIIATSFLACDTAIARALEGDVAPAANVENAETKSGPATALEGAKETGPAPSASEPADPPGASPALPARTAFDDYLDAKDDVYAFQVVTRVPGEGYETVLIELTSQEWLTPREVDRTVWKHWLVIVRPDVARSKHAFLYVSGGSNRRDPPSRPGGVSIAVARATGSVVAELRMVPNQPLEFFDDGKERYEDDLIAHAWTQFLKTGEPRWLPRLPMVKSVVRAMDAIQAFTKEDSDFPDIERFVVAGGSKRGWTTWFAGLDSRVAAIAPIVIDILNVQESMDHHYAAYGFWAPAIGDYEREQIFRWRNHPNWKRLLEIVDPYAYRHRLELPKYIVNASGDQFFLPDSSQFYFDDLRGEKHLRYVPNADHSLDGSDAAESVAAFYLAVATGAPRPKLEWTFEKEGSIRAQADTKPIEAKVWKATNPSARDFRVETIGRVWKSEPLERRDDGTYVAQVERPESGFTAFFIELRFPGVRKELPLVFTTAVRVVPDVLPNQDKLEALIEEIGRGGRG